MGRNEGIVGKAAGQVEKVLNGPGLGQGGIVLFLFGQIVVADPDVEQDGQTGPAEHFHRRMGTRIIHGDVLKHGMDFQPPRAPLQVAAQLGRHIVHGQRKVRAGKGNEPRIQTRGGQVFLKGGVRAHGQQHRTGHVLLVHAAADVLQGGAGKTALALAHAPFQLGGRLAHHRVAKAPPPVLREMILQVLRTWLEGAERYVAAQKNVPHMHMDIDDSSHDDLRL